MPRDNPPSAEDEPQPPEPPQVERRLRPPRLQLIGMTLILLVPVLALLGVFGESRASARAASTEVQLQVRYGARYRYKMLNEIEVTVRNTTDRTMDTLTVGFDPRYVSGFSQVTFIPSASEPYDVRLLDVRPGETRLVRGELQGERYGRHTGQVFATSGAADTARVSVSTFIFP